MHLPLLTPLLKLPSDYFFNIDYKTHTKCGLTELEYGPDSCRSYCQLRRPGRCGVCDTISILDFSQTASVCPP
nr:unnamed protein product [Spirometra erinaceieuropaei]